jgi:hypothetical protein
MGHVILNHERACPTSLGTVTFSVALLALGRGNESRERVRGEVVRMIVRALVRRGRMCRKSMYSRRCSRIALRRLVGNPFTICVVESYTGSDILE